MPRGGSMQEQVQRRKDPRYFLPHALGAELEFDGPDGERYRFPLMDISIRGASFSLPLRPEGIDEGAMLPNASILVDDLEIKGNLAVHYTVRRFRANYSCGVEFFPKTDIDQNQLVSFVSRLEAKDQAKRSSLGHPCMDVTPSE